MSLCLLGLALAGDEGKMLTDGRSFAAGVDNDTWPPISVWPVLAVQNDIVGQEQDEGGLCRS
jgi:hypothetical protein